jgi:hypothetical protein
MKNDILNEALIFEMHKKNYSKKEREIIKKNLLAKCKKIMQKSTKLFVQSMDDITNL